MSILTRDAPQSSRHPSIHNHGRCLVIWMSNARSVERGLARLQHSEESDTPVRVILVSSFRAYDPARPERERERATLARIKCAARANASRHSLIMLRIGDISPSIRSARNSSWHWLCIVQPLIPKRISSVFVSRWEVRRAIRRFATSPSSPGCRIVALLGTRHALSDILTERNSAHAENAALSAAICVAAAMGGRILVGAFLWLVMQIVPRWRVWGSNTIEPLTRGELVGLCHAVNRRHVVVAGHNTGVTHFGWRFPGQTIVRTTSTSRRPKLKGETISADAGTLILDVVRELRRHDRDLIVVPNYSYVSMGTVFMVPIHGSGTDVSTLGDTVESALVYDPARDKVVRLRRGDGEFEQCMYNPSRGMLVLRVTLRIRRSLVFFMTLTELNSPDADTLWEVGERSRANNLELRKSRAGDTRVELREYFTSTAGTSNGLVVPRDSIGRIWDRIESHSLSAWLFHAFVRNYGFHVELFLSREEFRTFWNRHAELPLSKIQLRFVRADHLPHSPIGDENRISIDIFLSRRKREEFLRFMKEFLPHARFNPGKHSV